MKARVKATGEIIHVRPYSGNSSSILWKDIYRNINYADCELDFEATNKDEIYNKGWADGWDEAVKSEIPKIYPKLKGSEPDYWERLEHQYAGMAMQGILACEEWKISPREGVSFAGEVALQAHELAHALIQELKEKEERK